MPCTRLPHAYRLAKHAAKCLFFLIATLSMTRLTSTPLVTPEAETIISLNPPVLSIVLHGRDDNYYNDLPYRLRIALEFLSEAIETLNGKLEVIFVDYCTERPLQSSIGFRNESVARRVNYVHVPEQDCIRVLNSNSFDSGAALQIGASVAKGRYIAFGPLDTIYLARSLATLVEVVERSDVDQCYWVPRYRVAGEYLLNRPNYLVLKHALLSNLRAFPLDVDHRNIYGNYGGIVVPKHIWVEASGLDRQGVGWGWNDIDFGQRLSYKYPQVDLLGFGVFCIDIQDLSSRRRVGKTPWYTDRFEAEQGIDEKINTISREISTFLPPCDTLRSSELVDRKFAVESFEARLAEVHQLSGLLHNDAEMLELKKRINSGPLKHLLSPELFASYFPILFCVRKLIFPLRTVLVTKTLQDSIALYVPLFTSSTHLTIFSHYDLNRKLEISGPLEHDNIFRSFLGSAVRRYYNLNFSEVPPEYLLSENYEHLIFTIESLRMDLVASWLKSSNAAIIAVTIFHSLASKQIDLKAFYRQILEFSQSICFDQRMVSSHSSMTFFLFQRTD